MSQLLETIKCKNGKLENLTFHNLRFNHARRNYFGLSDDINLEEIIHIPENYKSGLFRCRIIYSTEIKKIEFLPHQYKVVERLKLVISNKIDYHLKFADRSSLQNLFEKRGDCDDILIVKNGCITDSFTANPVFFDGKKWWTPNTPLLPGTQRARLLKEKKIFECRITPDDLKKFNKAGLINAMQNLNEMPVIEITNIEF